MSQIKDSDILREARRLIKKKQIDRICIAISEAGCVFREEVRANYLRRWVSKMLGQHSFFEDWMIEYHPEFAKKKHITSFDHADKLRPGRIVWLDWMIAECEKAEVSGN